MKTCECGNAPDSELWSFELWFGGRKPPHIRVTCEECGHKQEVYEADKELRDGV